MSVDNNIILEIRRVGASQEVRAVSEADGLEVSFVTPLNAASEDVEALARNKLAYVRRNRSSRAGGGQNAGRADELAKSRRRGTLA